MSNSTLNAFSVSGKTAIVTGAGSGTSQTDILIHHKSNQLLGINLCFAELLLSRNCNVVIADLSLRPEAQVLVSQYQKPGQSPRAVFVKTDITLWRALAHMFDVALAEFGAFDIVCPGAGVYEPNWSNFWHPPGSPESKDDLESGHYALLDINLTHPIRVTQLAISHWLHPRDTGSTASAKTPLTNPKRIVHVSSIAGQIPVFRAPLYGASKFGITGFIRCLGNLDSTGIRVNGVAPGVVRTPLWTEHPDKLKFVDQEHDSWVTPQECAEAMLQCVESERLVGGTILEIGKNHTRQVAVFNDPGPDLKNPEKGFTTSNSEQGDQAVWNWLGDGRVWAVPKL